MSALQAAHVRLRSQRRLPASMETARTREQALAIALEQEYGGYVYVLDFDDDYVYFAVENKRGVQRQEYTEDGDGNIELTGQPQRVRPKSSYQPAKGAAMDRQAKLDRLEGQIREIALRMGTRPPVPEAESLDFAALPVSPWAGPPPAPYRPAVAALPGQEVPLHMMAVLSRDEADFAPIAPGKHDRQPAPGGDEDFAEMPASPWDRKR